MYPKMREKVTAREINCRKRPVTRRIDQLSVRIYQENCVGLRETPCSIRQILAPSSAGEHLLELLRVVYAGGEYSVLYLVKNEIDPLQRARCVRSESCRETSDFLRVEPDRLLTQIPDR